MITTSFFETDNKLKPSEKEQLAATPAKSSDTTIAFHGERYYINTDKTEDSSIHVVGFISRGSLWNDIRYPIFSDSFDYVYGYCNYFNLCVSFSE